MSDFKLAELSAQQTRDWDITRARFVQSAPGFTHILYKMLAGRNHIVYATSDLPTAATNGRRVYVNPDFFFGLSLAERVFVLAHEVLHAVFNHPEVGAMYARTGKITLPDGTSAPFNQMLYNVATDYIINALLVKSFVGKMPGKGLHNLDISDGTESVPTVYARLLERFPQAKQDGAGDPTDGKGNGPRASDSDNGGLPKNFDEHLTPQQGGADKDADGRDATGKAPARDENAWRAAVSAAVSLERQRGDRSADLCRALEEVVEPTVDWTERLRTLVMRKIGGGSYDWRRGERRALARDCYVPSRSGNGCGLVVIGIDTSGSIGNKELAMFFGEMSGILTDCRPEQVVVIWCDARVNRVDELSDTTDLEHLRRQGAPGGGGTDFSPVFAEVDRRGLEPEALVYFTDGYGAFPPAPRYPVIWGDITKASTDGRYPFGDVVDIKLS